MRLEVRGFAWTCGVVCGLGLFLTTWWIIAFEGPAPPGAEPPFLGLVYRGYAFTPIGSLIGFAWAFADGLIVGALFAWLYNRFATRDGGAPAPARGD